MVVSSLSWDSVLPPHMAPCAALIASTSGSRPSRSEFMLVITTITYGPQSEKTTPASLVEVRSYSSVGYQPGLAQTSNSSRRSQPRVV